MFFEGTAELSGDYSGPEGARRVIRERRAQAAIIETARGGILRRGLAISQARVAVVTNISADHFGEYGIDDLSGLADVKLALAGVLPPDGLLVLNAEDAQLAAKAPHLAQRFGRCAPLGWFALDADHASLRAHRLYGGATCGVRDGRLSCIRRRATTTSGASRPCRSRSRVARATTSPIWPRRRSPAARSVYHAGHRRGVRALWRADR